MKLTEKQIFIKDLLSRYKKGATCYDIIKDYGNELKSQNISIDKINSVNATLASLATKELVTKRKVAYNDKMVTLYILKENN